MSFETRIKAVAWTEVEVATAVAGAVIATQWLPDEKIFSKAAKEHPEWFVGPREGAPFYIHWSGALKAGGALLASTYVVNPWVKLLLFGIAFQGTIQQARILTWNKEKGDFRVKQIGDVKERDLDARLKQMAAEYRQVNGPEYVGAPEYVGELPLSERYNSAVAAPYDELGNRYRSNVAGGAYDESEAFSLRPSDGVTAY